MSVIKSHVNKPRMAASQGRGRASPGPADEAPGPPCADRSSGSGTLSGTRTALTCCLGPTWLPLLIPKLQTRRELILRQGTRPSTLGRVPRCVCASPTPSAAEGKNHGVNLALLPVAAKKALTRDPMLATGHLANSPRGRLGPSRHLAVGRPGLRATGPNVSTCCPSLVPGHAPELKSADGHRGRFKPPPLVNRQAKSVQLQTIPHKGSVISTGKASRT